MPRGAIPSPSDPPGAPWSSATFALGTAAAAWSLSLAVAVVRCIVYGFSHPLMLIERHAVSALVAVGLSGLIFLGLRRIEAAAMRRRLVAALLATVAPAALLSVINYNVMFVFVPQYYLRDMGMDMHLNLLGEVLYSAIDNYFVFAAWAVLYTSVSHAVQTQDVLRRAAAADAAARLAELRALRFQLDPHFLFNALNTVSGLVVAGDLEAADRTLEALSSFLRATLAIDASEDVSLADELHLQELYLQIEQVRFGRRLAVDVDLPPTLAQARVPALLLQPLIENSIRHGVARSVDPVRIVVSAQARAGWLHLAVADDAPGAAPSHGHGKGLANVASRLALRYGGAASCKAGAGPAGGFETRLTLPLLYAPGGEALAA